MQEIKRGDAVTRHSYNHDIVFLVKKIIKLSNKQEVAILKGIDVRILCDAPIEDLKILSKEERKKREKDLENKIINKIEFETTYRENRKKEVIYTGRILHLDGDTHLSNPKKHRNINTSKQVIFSHNRNNVSKIKIHYFFGIRRD